MSNNSKVVATVAAASLGLYVAYNLYRALTKKSTPASNKESNEKTTKKNNVLKLPVIEIAAFFNKSVDPEGYKVECKKVADALHKYGVAIVRDPRVDERDNNTFLDMLEKYFELSDGVRDARPEYHYQVGVTPSHVGKSSYFAPLYNV